MNWNYRGRQRNAPVTGVGIESGTFNYYSKRLYVDVLGEYYFWKRVGFFVNLRNIGDATEDMEILGPNTPSTRNSASGSTTRRSGRSGSKARSEN